MENRYDIRPNLPPLDAETIKQTADFQALLKRHQTKTPQAFWQKRSFYWALASTASLLALLTWFYLGPDKAKEETAVGLSQDPPLHQDEAAGQESSLKTRELSFEAGQDQTFKTATGTQFSLTALSFETPKGDLVQGPIKLSYEASSQAEKLLLGPWQNLDFGDAEHYLSSWGLLYLSAKQNGQSLRLQAGKSLKVEWEKSLDETLNLQHYQTEKGRWETVKTIEVQDKTKAKTLAVLERQYPQPPAPPSLKRGGAVFEIDFERDEFPELQRFGKVSWETDETLLPEWSEVVWEEARIEREGSAYRAFFGLNGREISFKVYPVLPASEQAARLEAEANYQKALKLRAETIARALDSISSSKAGQPMAKQVFELDRLGLWNLGHHLPLQSLKRVKKRFVLEGGETLVLHRLLLIYEQGRRIYFRTWSGGAKQADLGLATGAFRVLGLDDKGRFVESLGGEQQIWQFRVLD